MTPGRIEAYLGLIFSAYGLALFVLGIVALLGTHRERVAGRPAHLGWLAAFGVLHGLHEFIMAERLHNAAMWLSVLGSALMVGSFVALLEFGRRSWNARPAARRLPALPLFVAAGLGTVACLVAAPTATAGLELGARYLFGAPGAALAGVGLLAHAATTVRAPGTTSIIYWLRVSGLVMFAYAALTLFLSPAAWQAAGLPSAAGFLNLTGVPVELARCACAVLLALGFFNINLRVGALTAMTLRRVSDNLNGFVYRCRNDRDWTVIFMSEGGENLTGYPSADFLHGERHFADQIHPDDREQVWDEVQVAVAERREFRLQFRMINRAGGVHWCYEEGRGVFDANGDLLFLEGFIREDDARHRALQALQRERDLASNLVETAPVIVLLLNADGTIRHVNSYFERLSGYRLEEISGTDWFALCLPASERPRVREFFHAAIDGLPVAGNVDPIITRSGEERAIEWHAAPLGDTDGLLCIGMDVTERQQLDDQLREANRSLEQRVVERTADMERELKRNSMILGTATDGFFAVGPSGAILQTNPAFCAMLGYDEAELLRMRVFDIVAEKSYAETAAQIEKVIAQGHDRFDTRHRRKDGSAIDVEVSGKLVILDGERIFYAFARDISARKAAEVALREARDEAEAANAAKNEFLSRMSHELRTPLNAIMGFAQVLQLPGDGTLDEQQADNVREIQAASERLLGLVDEVLDLARIESGHLELDLVPVALDELVERCAAQIRPFADARAVSLTLHMGGACAVLADPARLEQVLFNLLSNAVKYNRQGGRIDVESVPVAGQRARLSVRDTGYGLSAEQQTRLFLPFERMESAYEGIEGAGIGLALSRQLIEGMQGAIGADSIPGEGSTFWFELPLDSGESIASVPENEPPAIADTRADRGTVVLYIEDNPANLRLVRKILGYRAATELLAAENAEDGLVLALREQPDLILLDLNLPGMDGFAALQRLRGDPATRSIPVIAVTANAMERDIERGRAAGFQDYFVKPINIERFLATIEPYLGASKGEQ